MTLQAVLRDPNARDDAPAPIVISPMAAGQGAFTVEVVDGQSAITSACASNPLKLLIPRPRGQSVWVYAGTFGGGMVAGDETKVSIQLGSETRCFLGTQASTKVYRDPLGRGCGLTLRATVSEGSLLALVPDPVQSFAESSYTQRQEFHLEGDASLVLVDWVTSGRAARGERWAFTGFRSRNEIFLDSELMFADSMILDPLDGALDGPHRLGRFNCLALVVLFGERLLAARERLLTDVAAQPIARKSSLLLGASPIRQGAVLRLAGETVEVVGREIRRRLEFLPSLLGDDPIARKW